jgi:hypothetical protein
MTACIQNKLHLMHVRWWEGGREAENLDDEQDVDTGASSNHIDVSTTNKTQKDKIQSGGG